MTIMNKKQLSELRATVHLKKIIMNTGGVMRIRCIEKCGPFLKVWSQNDRNSVLYLEQTLTQIIPQLEHDVTLKPSPENVHIGMLCGAKYKDNVYYRVQITNTSLLNQNLVEVQFIDYGNNDLVPVTNLRMFSTVASGLTMIPPQAQDFILANVTFPGSAWNPQTLKILNDDLAMLDLQYFIVGQNSGVTFIKLYENSEDVLLKYFNSGLILSIASNAQYMIVQNMVTSQNMVKMSPRQLEAPQVTPFAPITQTPPTFATYKAMTLEANVDHQVYISYVADGPCQFYVQLQNFETNLARLMNDLNRMTLEPLEEDPLPGTVCVARCLEDDHICRAVVTNMVDGKYKVFFVDFGNTESIPIDNIYKIPFKYILPRVLAVRYSLASVENSSVTLEMKCAFKDFVSDKLLLMRSYAPRGRTAISQCDLWDSTNMNVLDVLKQAALLAYPNVPQLVRGSNHEVRVSYVHSCSRFYVQISSKDEELRNLMEKLQVQCPLANDVSFDKLKIGSPCNALFNVDNQWYRAQVVGIVEDAVTVKYVDYGNEELVSIDNIKTPIYELLTTLKPQAIECCLNGYQNMSDEVERDNILEQVILEKEFSMKVIEVIGSKVLVDLIDPCRYNVGSLILEKIANSRSHVSPILIQEDLNFDLRKRISPSSDQKFLRKSSRDNDEQETQDSWRQSKIQSEAITEKQESWRQNKPSRKETWNEGSNKRNDFENTNTGRSPKEYDNGFNRRSESYDKDNHRKSNFKREERGSKEYSPSSQRSPSFSRDNNDRKRDNNERKRFNDDKNWRHNDNGDFSNDSKPRRRPDSNSKRGYSPAPSNKSDNYKQSSPSNRSDNYKQSKNVSKLSNPVLYTTPFKSHELENQSVNVSVCWFHNPSHFYCQLTDKQAEFELMMKEIQDTYVNIKPERNVPVGSSVVALFPEDDILYRARILNSQNSQYRVQYIDFGNVSTTDKVWPVEKKYMDLPAQAVYCGLNGLLPCDTDWSDADAFSNYFNKESFTCNIISKENDEHKVELVYDDKYVSQMLVDANLARFENVEPTIELPILLGQQLRVLLIDVQSLDSILVQLDIGCVISCSMHNLGTAENCYEQTLKDHINNNLIIYVDNVLETQLEVTFYDLMGSKLQIIEPDEGAFSTIEPICMFPVYYSNIVGRVVYFTEKKEKFQLCIQFDEYLDAINHILDSLFNHYNDSVMETPLTPQVGTIYAVLSSDSNWYRGEVTSIDNQSVNILFIDYGNSENINVQNLRELDNQFKSQHMLCLNVLTSTFIDGQILEQEITGEVYYADDWEIYLYTIGGVAVESAPVISESNKLEEITTEVGNNVPQSVAVDEATPQEEPVGSGYSVILSHFDTPNEFYLQFTDEIDKIEDLLSTIQEQVNEWPNLENPAAGMLCAAPFSVDQQWYRALILDADSDITTVRFLDYGNTDVIDNSVTVLKTLPSELLAITQYAQRYSLLVKPTDEEWSQTACEKFEELTKSDNLSVDIAHQDEKLTYVELYSYEVNVADALVKEKLVEKFEIETSKSGYLSHLNSPSEFWVQFENTVADLEWVADQLTNVEKFPEVEDMTPGSLCVALFPDDDMWYRARILSNTIAGIEVLFIDYGNSCLCTGLKQLPEDMIMLPPLAQKCSLQKPNGILQWSDKAIEEFKTLSADGATVFNIHKISTGETSVVKLLLEGEDIISRLLPITKDCYIVHFESISSFWIHLISDEQKLESINQQLALASELPKYEDAEVLSNIVVALFPDDGLWYRAQIVNVNESNYEVLLLDYGNSSIVNDVRIASDEIKREEPLAYLCKLEPLPGFCWIEDSSLTLSDISNNGNTAFTVEFVNKNTVRLYLNGSDVRMQLPSETLSSAHNTPKKNAVKLVEEHNDELALDEVNHVIDVIIDSIPVEDSKQLEHSNIINKDLNITSTDDVQVFSDVTDDTFNIDQSTTANDANEEIVHEITENIIDVDKLQEDITNAVVNDTSDVVTEITEDLISVEVLNQGESAIDEFVSDTNEVLVSEITKDLNNIEISSQEESATDEFAGDTNKVVLSEIVKELVVPSEISSEDISTTDILANDSSEVVTSEIKTSFIDVEVSQLDESTSDASNGASQDVVPEATKDLVEIEKDLEVSNQDKSIIDELGQDVVPEVFKDLIEVEKDIEVSKQVKSIVDELDTSQDDVLEILKDLIDFEKDLEASNQDKSIVDELGQDVVPEVFKDLIKVEKDIEVSNQVKSIVDELDTSQDVVLEILKDLIDFEKDLEASNQDKSIVDELGQDVVPEVFKDLIKVKKDIEVSNQDDKSITDELDSDTSQEVVPEVLKGFVEVEKDLEASNQDKSIVDEFVDTTSRDVVPEAMKDLIKKDLEISNQDKLIVDELDTSQDVVPEVLKDLIYVEKDIEVSNQDDKSITDELDSVDAFEEAMPVVSDLEDVVDADVLYQNRSTIDLVELDGNEEVLHKIMENLDLDASENQVVNDETVQIVPEVVEDFKTSEISNQAKSSTDLLVEDEHIAAGEDFLDIEISPEEELFFNKLDNDKIQHVSDVKDNLHDTDELKEDVLSADNSALRNDSSLPILDIGVFNTVEDSCIAPSEESKSANELDAVKSNEKSCNAQIEELENEEKKITSCAEKSNHKVDQLPKPHSEKIVPGSISRGDLSEIETNEQV